MRKDLTKKYRIKWADNKGILDIGEFKESTVMGCLDPCAEFDTLKELTDRVESEQLTFSEDQKKDPEILKLLGQDYFN